MGLRFGGGEDKQGVDIQALCPPCSWRSPWRQLGSLYMVHRDHGGGVFLPRTSPAILSSVGRKDDGPCWDRTSFTMDTAFTFYVPQQARYFCSCLITTPAHRLLPPMRNASSLTWDLHSDPSRSPCYLKRSLLRSPVSHPRPGGAV